jgi:uncharacterized protein (TIGR03790 family)
MNNLGRLIAILLLPLQLLLAPDYAQAGGGPQNLAVIVNPADPDSLAVANAYVEMRRIPASNVLYIRWNPEASRTTAPQFRDRLIKSMFEQLKQRKIIGQINGVAFSTGYPYLVDCAPLFPAQQFPQQAKPFASLTSATYLYRMIQESKLEFFSLTSNGYFAPIAAGKTTSQAFVADLGEGQGDAAQKVVRRPYLMAVALGVSHGRGNTPAEIIAYLRRAAKADGAKYRGTIYYMKNNDIRSRVRDQEFAAAMKELSELGVKSELLPGAVPANKRDVAGLTTGSPTLNLRSADCTLLPGSLVDNLTSAAGQFTISPDALHPQTPVSEFLRLGAGGASGMVVEPMAIPAKFPSPHLHVHYARGCSLAEAFYQSVAGPFQLLIVGDPLCQPWAVAPKVSVEGAAEGAVLEDQVKLTPTAKYQDDRATSQFELYVNGIRRQTIAPGESFTLRTTGMSDGFHELRVVAIDNTPVAVEGSWIATIQVRNGRDAIQLRAPAGSVSLGDTLVLESTSTRQEDAVIFHNGRRLGVVTGGSGKLLVEAKVLGAGRVQLWAQQPGRPTLRSRPLTVEIK